MITPSQARALGAPAVPSGSSRASVARAFALQNARALGLRGDLGPSRSAGSLAGGSVVRFDQVVGGVPVMGGQVVVDVSRAGDVQGALSETLPGAVPSTAPRVASTAAALVARADARRAVGGVVADLVVTEPALTVFDAAILGVPGLPGGRLAWRTEVRSATNANVRRLVVVDAETGDVLLSVDQIAESVNRTVCDAANIPATSVPCTSPVMSEGQTPPPTPVDVGNAYTYAGKTYAFYDTVLGRKSVDGHDAPLVSTVRYCPSSDVRYCPYGNAFWNGDQMVYGAGWASADDVVAHELTHGVTEHTSNLFYFFQSGAINESLSDIFGEFVDLTDGVGNDTAGVRWKLGEDLPIGAVRDMSDPPAFSDPDSTQSALFQSGVSPNGAIDNDSGAVHTNSGVGNKFAYLLADGGTFRGSTVVKVGIEKAATIIYAASQLLTSASDYRGFAAALRQACSALVVAAKVTAADCAQVEAAITSTAMDIAPVSAPAAAPAACAAHPGTTAVPTWVDDFENPASGRWTAPNAIWSYASATSSAPDYTSSGNHLWGDDPLVQSDLSIAMTTAVPVRATSYMRFTHAYGFEGDASLLYDGGVLEYSVSGAAGPWADAGSMIVAHGYTGSISGQYDNPLKSRAAFTGASRGWLTTQVDLSTLAGQTARFRFRIGTDTGGMAGVDAGWFVDDVQFGDCDTPPAAPVVTGATASGAAIAVTFAPAANSGALPTTHAVTCTSGDGGAPASAPADTSGAVTVGGLTPGRNYTCTVTATNALGASTSGPSASVHLLDVLTPTLTAPVPAAVTLTAPVFTARATDDVGVIGFDVRRRTATATGGWTAWSAPVRKPGSTLRWVETFKAGVTTCLEITARDADGNASPPLTRCTTTPLDERSLVRSSTTAWTRAARPTAYRATLSTSTKVGARLSLTGARGRGLVLVVRKGPGNGSVGVYVGTKRVLVVKLAASTVAWRRLVPVPTALLTGQTVSVRVLTAGTGVSVDGLAVRR